MKHILGLDLGTNSIGWAVLQADASEKKETILKGIVADGSRIIPMDAAMLGNFEAGNSVSQTRDRTMKRGLRRLRERELLRRERLHRVLKILGFLPEHYAAYIDEMGKFIDQKGCKLAWDKDRTGKYAFLFQSSFQEMLEDFEIHQPQLVAEGKRIPYDWTLYYLRKKALTQKIQKEELAWILLNFNQKRGYYQLGDEDEEKSDERTDDTDDKKKSRSSQKKPNDFMRQKVTKISELTKDEKGMNTYLVVLENGLIGKATGSSLPNWTGEVIDLMVYEKKDKQGEVCLDENNIPERKFVEATDVNRVEDSSIIRLRLQEILDEQHMTVGTYIYETLLQNPNQKVKKELVCVVDRRYYKEELLQILTAQAPYHPELQDAGLYNLCIENLYKSNVRYRKSISQRDILYLFIDNILFYQRKLKSKKSTISDCPYESVCYLKDGELKHEPLKAIAKSSPLYQEFRIWQFISNLRIYQKEVKNENTGHIDMDVDVTNRFLDDEKAYESLFNFLNGRKDIEQSILLSKVTGVRTKVCVIYRWNYVEDKSYPCNTTRAALLAGLKKAGIEEAFLTRDIEFTLWHILYSADAMEEKVKAIHTFAEKYQLPESFEESFKELPPFKKEYGSYSTKAIRKLLTVMRRGSYWSEAAIEASVKERIQKIIDGEYDASISDRSREKLAGLKDISQFRGLPEWLACYAVYGKHSEATDIQKWRKPEDIDEYLKHFKQHSLRNPVVEQVVTETLRTVRDIWSQIGSIDEIHIELGREMKNSADKRSKMAKQIQDNENTNLRIKALLAEFAKSKYGIQDVRPFSPYQQDIMRIYEDGALQTVDKVPDDIAKIISKFNQTNEEKRPTENDFQRYKLWLEQKYRSPYTGQIISLGKLFTTAYQIEHVIPKARYFDDSFSNKVICESEVNQEKSQLLGHEFIQKNHGRYIETSSGKVRVFEVEEYEQFVNENYAKNRTKRQKLLMDEIPEDFIKRQLNDSRYISNLVKGLLSNIVREEDEQETVSKNVISCSGNITDRLKKDWGVNDIWNRIIYPRFLRMNKLTESSRFTTKNAEGKDIPDMPLEYQKGFSKKRIDHRHHAMDAIVIACANRNIVNYLNNASACKDAPTSRTDLQRLLCDKVRQDDKGNYSWAIKKPWGTFTQDMQNALLNTTTSYKHKLRVINKTKNYYQHINENGRKEMIAQTKGDNFAVRRAMNGETYYGEVNLRKEATVKLEQALLNPNRIINKDLKRKLQAMLQLDYSQKQIEKYFKEHQEEWQEINLSKIPVYIFSNEAGKHYYASRKAIDTSFSEEKIAQITDTGIQQIMRRHLAECDNDPKVAFSPEGIERMNRDIVRLNNGKSHQPIYKVRKCESGAKRSPVGQVGNKRFQYIQGTAGTNLYYAIYEGTTIDKETGELKKERKFTTLKLEDVLEPMKKNEPFVSTEAEGYPLKYLLSTNDLVYVPTEDEIKCGKIQEPIDRDRIYVMVSSNKKDCFFRPVNVASILVNKVEFEAMNKIGRAITGEMIKDTCVPVSIDRLGNIKIKD